MQQKICQLSLYCQKDDNDDRKALDYAKSCSLKLHWSYTCFIDTHIQIPNTGILHIHTRTTQTKQNVTGAYFPLHPYLCQADSWCQRQDSCLYHKYIIHCRNKIYTHLTILHLIIILSMLSGYYCASMIELFYFYSMVYYFLCI